MKKIIQIFTVLVFVSFLSLAGCSPVQSESDKKPAYQTITCETAYAALMASEGHRKNMLNASCSYIGIGIADSPNGKVFVQMFVKK